MDETVFQELLEDVKNYLDITWDDPATNQKVAGYTQAGIRYLDRKAGETLDYTTGSDAWALLMDYVRYARDGAMDVFESNYQHLILAMQHDRQLARREQEERPNEKDPIPAGQ